MCMSMLLECFASRSRPKAKQMVATSLPCIRVVYVCFYGGQMGPPLYAIRSAHFELKYCFGFSFYFLPNDPIRFSFFCWWLKVFHSRSIFSLFSSYYLKNDERQRKEDGFTSSSPHDDDDVFLFRPPNRSIDSDYFQQYIIRQQRTTIAPLGWTRFSGPSIRWR
jgi:hypothetical protein